MDERERIAAAIERTVDGPVWHGEGLAALLDGCTATDAAAHPLDDAHSIWELVLHLTSWAEIVHARLPMIAIPEATDEEDWPLVPRTTTANWATAVSALGAAHQRLAAAVRTLDVDTLDDIVPSRAYTLRMMLHGISEHGAYHGGQIALLRRAIEL
jgi:uncharacterized damage-inducible protein DinB